MTLLRPLVMQAAEGDTELEYSALEWRTFFSVLWRNEGVLQALSPGISALKVTQRSAGANFSVDINAGAALITGDDAPNQGAYIVRSTAVENKTIPSPPVSGSRTHRVIAKVRDKLHNGTLSDYDLVLEVLEDEGSGVPDTPDTALSLATVTVAAAQSSVLDTHITDTRPVALLGPNRPTMVGSDALRPAVPATPEIIWRSDKGYFEVWNGTEWLPWLVDAWDPIQVSNGSTVTSSSMTFVPGTPVLSTTFPAPPSGKIWVTITAQVEAETPSSGIVTFQIHNGSTSAGSVFLTAAQENGVAVQEDHYAQASTETLVEGLTPGATYYIEARLRTTGAGDVTAFYRRLGLKAA